MEGSSGKDLMIAGCLAILIHVSVALLTRDLTNDRVPRFEPAGLTEEMTIDLVASSRGHQPAG
jgi:hypothetical protein